MSECHFDHSFNGSENEIGLRNGDEGPRPPNKIKTPEEIAEGERLYGLIVIESTGFYRAILTGQEMQPDLTGHKSTSLSDMVNNAKVLANVLRLRPTVKSDN